MRAVTLIAVWAGLAIGNFAWQMFGDALWAVAAERSFFQGLAVLAVWLTGLLCRGA